jgi:hypothetical protein
MITGKPLHKYNSSFARNEFIAQRHGALLHKHRYIVLCTPTYFLITFLAESDG